MPSRIDKAGHTKAFDYPVLRILSETSLFTLHLSLKGRQAYGVSLVVLAIGTNILVLGINKDLGS